MSWTGKLNEDFLEDRSLLTLANIIEKKRGILKISIEDKNKDEFIHKAIKSIKGKSYIYLVKDKVMYLVFENHMFKFSKGYPELETARSYGESLGIPKEEMNFEYFIEHPVG